MGAYSAHGSLQVSGVFIVGARTSEKAPSHNKGEDHAGSHCACCTALKFSKSRISDINLKLEIAQSEQDVSPFCKESDMTYR